MKLYINLILSFITSLGLITGCGENQDNEIDEPTTEAGHHEQEVKAVHFSSAQFEALSMKVDTLPRKNISAVVHANGQLEVPPQNEATVTAVIGANISSIQVIEGEEVKKGQVLAYLMHPDLTRLQEDYHQAYNNLQYLEEDYQRQKRLYKEEVGSGKTYQKTQRDYRTAQSTVKSLESQLRQIGINPNRIQQGSYYDQVPVASPIEGTVVKVEVRTGQFVQPEKDLIEIINTHHIHADLMVFEKDVHKVNEGQRVRFKVETLPNQELFAEIYSVGKKFEQDPKAVHVHAEIENKTGKLIPGMYIKGEILTDSTMSYALPEGAIARVGNKYFAFLANKEVEGESESWIFTPVEVVTSHSNNNWLAVKFFLKIPKNSLFAMNNAYYLIAEMNKGDAGHDH